MSGWLHNLVVQARGAGRAVRAVTTAYGSPAFSPDAAGPSLTSEMSRGVGPAPAPAPAASAPAIHAESGNGTQREHQRHEADGRSTQAERAPATQRQHPAVDSDDGSVRPTRNSPRRESSASDDPVDHEVRGRRGREQPVVDEAWRVPMLPDHAPLGRLESTASLIRPALSPRAAAPAREAAGFTRPAPVPDVHIHIGRVELTAVTAPPPRRERAPAPNNRMSLDEYLRRRNGGAP